MGIIIDRIKELEPILTYIQNISNKYYIPKLNAEIRGTVYNAFELLKPLSYKETVIKEYVDYELGVSLDRWVKVRYSRNMPNIIVTDEEQFFECIRKYGHEMIKHVRKSIRDEFAALVELTSKIEQYKEKKYYLDVDKQVMSIRYDDRLTFIPLHVVRVEVDVMEPAYVLLRTDEDDEYKLSINALESIPVLEYVLDEVLSIYENIKQDIEPIKRHNDRLLQEINRLILPRRLSKEIGSDE